jgi:hypothetical protein
VPLSLKNVTTGKAIKYGEREYGINLIWDSSGKSLQNISLEVISGSSDSIKDGEPVAIKVDGGGYLRYAEREYGINARCEREYGINLKWSPTPVYEWEIRGIEGQGQIGTLYTESNIGIYNRTHQQYIVYCKREYGINLSWQKDCKRFAPPEGDPQVPNSASVVLSYSTGLLADVPCYGDLSWKFTPVKLTGSSGKSVRFRINGGCRVVVSTLRPGTWRIQAGRLQRGSAEYEVKLYPGANSFLLDVS